MDHHLSPGAKVLFVCHSASRNGATILLLDLIRWLKPRVDWDLHVLMHGTGPLLADFQALAHTTIWRDPGPALDVLFRRSTAGLRRLVEDNLCRFQLPSGQYDLVYANTMAAAPSVQRLVHQTNSLLWHIHELAYALRVTASSDVIKAALHLPGHGVPGQFVAASHAVKHTLCSTFGVTPDIIDVVHSFTPVRAVSVQDRWLRRTRIRAELNIPQDAWVIGGCGSLGWRKGTDLFIQIAKAVKQTAGARVIRFLWIGGQPGSSEWMEFFHDIAALELREYIHMVPDTPDVGDYYCTMDNFALTSREEPFCLVVLEAAEHGMPCVCFQGAGGTIEFIGDDAGISVPYLDVTAFAAQLIRLHDCSDLRTRMGRVGQSRVREHYRVDTQGPKLLRTMQYCLDRGRAPAAITARATA